MLADALGRPMRFFVTAGQAGDITQAPAVPEGQTGEAILAIEPITAMPYEPSSPSWTLTR